MKQDIRTYEKVVNILKDLNITCVNLITNNPKKKSFLINEGINVEKTVRLKPIVRDENCEYLYTKKEKLDHALLLENEE